MIDIYIYLSLGLLFFQKVRLAKILPVPTALITFYPLTRGVIELLSINDLSLETKSLIFQSYIIEIIIFTLLIYLFKKYLKINPFNYSKNTNIDNFDKLFIIVSIIGISSLSFLFSSSGEVGDSRNLVYQGLGPIRYLFTSLNFITTYGCFNKISKFYFYKKSYNKPILYWIILLLILIAGFFSGSKKGLLILLPLMFYFFIINFNFDRIRKAFISKNLLKISFFSSFLIIPTIIIIRLRKNNFDEALYALFKRIQYTSGYNFILDKALNNGILKENPFQENVFSFITYYFSRSDISMNIGNNLKSLALNKSVIGGPVANSIKSYFLMSSQDPFSFSMLLFCLNHILILLFIGYVIKLSATKDSFIMNGITLSLCTFLFTSFYDAYVLYSVLIPILFIFFGYFLTIKFKILR